MSESSANNILELPAVLTVKQLSELLNQPVTAVIGKLMEFGVMATINEDIDFDTAAIVADEFAIAVSRKATPTQAVSQSAVSSGVVGTLNKRPPVVTIMGHVDHGKTTLLDTIRKTNVAAKEAGGITQHISSYQIEISPKKGGEKRIITFLDTPGHSAFEAMRRHGAQITDLVVLVVAADDGVKPQTVEALNHAKVMNVPILVAINKIDKPDADPERVKRELSEYNLLTEEWGGKTTMVPISAKQGDGIPELLELVLLATDLKDLKANFEAPAVGVVVESHQELGIGPVATVLIQNGTLRIGDNIAIGSVSGKVRTLSDYRGKRIELATPSVPVEISGLSAVPNFGDQLAVLANEKDARDAANQNTRVQTAKKAVVSLSSATPTTQKEGNKSILNVVVKADTNGSLEAIKNGLGEMKNADVEVRVVSSGVGDISENDITMASTSHATVLGFTVRLPSSIKSLADREKVGVFLYTVVYELFESIRDVLTNLMPMETLETEVARLKILARFRDNKKDVVVGGMVIEGSISKDLHLRITRHKEVISEGRIVSLRQGKDEIKTVKSGSECGMELDLRSGRELVTKDDIISFYTKEEKRKPFYI